MNSDETNTDIQVLPLIDQSWTVERIFEEYQPYGWEKLFEECKDEIKDISDYLKEKEDEDGSWFPMKKDLLKPFELVTPENVKVVIFGNYPYDKRTTDGEPMADGLAFSTRQISPVLKTIFQEVKNCIPNFEIPLNGSLESWTSNGVLLINRSLTVQPNKANSHGNIWLGFIRKLILFLNEVNQNAVYLLWGQDNKMLKEHISNKNPVLISGYPNAKSFEINQTFEGCKHFKLANEILQKKNIPVVNWNLR
jgi:uracil-DNA glycosylase